MEQTFLFRVYYGSVFVKTVVAHSKWEAIEKAYSKLITDYPHLIRSKFKAEKAK